ncbi:MAG TPA: DUF1003 domain-containing protein [Nitrolancea sp.]|nr:DUF1003 domain-containing protein [Nitrolancea sp.]
MSTIRERLRVLVGLLAAELVGRRRETAHDRAWGAHPAVATGDELTAGQRAADMMRSGLGTWTFLGVLAGCMALWMVTGGFGRDPAPFILLNLCLSTLAGVQAAVLLIAAKRSDQVAAATALHTLQNTEKLAALIEQNTALTEQVAQLTREVHAAQLATRKKTSA